MIFTGKKKIQEILAAKELLRVESRNKSISRPAKHLLIALTTIGYIFAIQLTQEQEILFAWIISMSIFYIFLLVIIIRLTTGRGKPIMFTERGIVIDPLLAEFWGDIDKYGWETFKGLTRTSFSSEGEGICLYILDKKVLSRSVVGGTGHSMLAQYGIFFTKEQVKEVDIIFQKYGISKIDL